MAPPGARAAESGMQAKRFAGAGSALATAMFVWTMLSPLLWRMVVPFLPRQLFGRLVHRYARLLAGSMDPYITLTVGGKMSDLAKAYLSDRCARRARALRADRAPGRGVRFVLSLEKDEEVADEFRGATVWWRRAEKHAAAAGGSKYRLTFHERHRDLVVESYLGHVWREGSAIIAAGRWRKLFTNTGVGSGKKQAWTSVAFEHPSTFATLAIAPAKKRDIMDDLDAFRNGKEYYARIGKAWKRGYLLHGPPGTGKSTMIAAMANYLDYDIYDVELTSVENNTELRQLFLETRGKSMIVIEDIDCSVDLTGRRNKKAKAGAGAEDDDDVRRGETKVTLSGLLNAIDGLWSACGGERIIVFTTNHVEKLDPALIRRGRMDKHIEMSYCCFEAFKVLAMNYLAADDHHPLFDDIKALLLDARITPAAVAEHLIPKRRGDGDSCLASLVKSLQISASARKEETV